MRATYKINDAANEDIRKLTEADAKLVQAKASIDQLNKIASGMQSETGIAICDQCSRLTSSITTLQNNLTVSKQWIRMAVEWYREQDKI